MTMAAIGQMNFVKRGVVYRELGCEPRAHLKKRDLWIFYGGNGISEYTKTMQGDIQTVRASFLL